jgi:hypothetical protein
MVMTRMQLLRDLGTSRRRHDLPALQVTAEAGQESYEKDGRRQGDDGIIGAGVSDKMQVNEPLGAKEKRRRKDQTGTEQEPQGNVENSFGSQEIVLG